MTADPDNFFACQLDGKGGAQPLDWLESLDSQSIWLHLDLSHRQSREVLTRGGAPQYVVETLTRRESRPRAVEVGDGLMVILRGINRNAGADPEDMVSFRMWIDSGRLFSGRLRRVWAVKSVQRKLEDGIGPRSIPELIIAVISELADGISLFVENIEERVGAFEDSIGGDAPSGIRSEISAVRRQLASVRRYLAPQRDALDALCRLAGRLLSTDQLFALREQSDRMTRYIEDLDLVRERALVAQEELMSRISEEQNNRTYVLSVIAAIFLPITFISGVFGMNTAGLPGLENAAAFWIVAAAMAVISFAIILWLRLVRWF